MDIVVCLCSSIASCQLLFYIVYCSTRKSTLLQRLKIEFGILVGFGSCFFFSWILKLEPACNKNKYLHGPHANETKKEMTLFFAKLIIKVSRWKKSERDMRPDVENQESYISEIMEWLRSLVALLLRAQYNYTYRILILVVRFFFVNSRNSCSLLLHYVIYKFFMGLEKNGIVFFSVYFQIETRIKPFTTIPLNLCSDDTVQHDVLRMSVHIIQLSTNNNNNKNNSALLLTPTVLYRILTECLQVHTIKFIIIFNTAGKIHTAFLNSV